MKKILFIFAALSLLAFASCSKDDDAVEQQNGKTSNAPLHIDPSILNPLPQYPSDRIDWSGRIFLDSTTTFKFETINSGKATISIDVDTATITVDATFSYYARSINSVSCIEPPDFYFVAITMSTDNMEVVPSSAYEMAKEMLQGNIEAVYFINDRKLDFDLIIPQGRKIDYILSRQ